MVRKILLPLALVGLAILVAGCGEPNHPPEASPASLATNEDEVAVGTLTASDPDGDPLTLRLGTPPSHGTVTLTGGRAFTFAPDPEANGLDSFSLVVTDPDGEAATATITVTIVPVADPPAIVATLSLEEDSAATASLVSEPDGQSFTVTVVTAPSHGTFSAEGAPGRFSYVPTANFNGGDTVVLTAEDATGLRSTRTVAITVRPVNDAPVASADSAVLLQGTPFRIDPRMNDTDVDGDPLTVEVVDMPPGWTATVRTDGALDVTPPAAFMGGPLTMNYRARDSGGLTSASTVALSAAFTNGVLYWVQTAGAQRDLWYSDGIREFRVSAAMSAGEMLQEVRAAKSAPVVFYKTRLNTVVHLFRVDLRNPAVVQEIESPVAFPGVGEFAFSDDGTRLIYAFGGRYKFIDFAVSTAPIDRGAAEDGLLLDSNGTHAYYRGLRTQQPYTLWGALFAQSTLDALPRQQLTATLVPNDGVGRVRAVSRDGRRLFFATEPAGGNGVLMVMDPSLPGSERRLLSGATDAMGFSGLTEDENRFFGPCAPGGVSGYCLGSMQGESIVLTSGTGTEFIAGSALSGDGSVFAYSRATVSGPGYAARLYRVDTANPNAPVPIADDLPPSTVGYTLGVHTVHISRNGKVLLFATGEMVPHAAGGYVPGNGRLYMMDPAIPTSRQILWQGPEAVGGAAISSDGTMGVLLQRSSTTIGSVHAVNLRDPSQILALDAGPSDVAQLVPGHASQGL